MVNEKKLKYWFYTLANRSNSSSMGNSSNELPVKDWWWWWWWLECELMSWSSLAYELPKLPPWSSSISDSFISLRIPGVLVRVLPSATRFGHIRMSIWPWRNSLYNLSKKFNYFYAQKMIIITFFKWFINIKTCTLRLWFA